ncbi:hypothetical protein HanXRQr2_Chr06g0265341 [Helianthus annuus]|uniref:Uncharacterized protein n=1 Tax=Helianthus annuus TaxID=4232 RepID=A0A9K3ITQ0_HELAN|nr:hypothetical protein HanXRQr2_Chr06g0265341 [Helianthus annuus]
MKFFHLGPATSSEYSFKLLARFMNHVRRRGGNNRWMLRRRRRCHEGYLSLRDHVP